MSIFPPIHSIVWIRTFPFLACALRSAASYVNPSFVSAGDTMVRVRYGGLAVSVG